MSDFIQYSDIPLDQEFPENEWVEDLTAGECIKEIKAFVRKARKAGIKLDGMQVLVGGGGSDTVWLNCSRAWTLDFITRLPSKPHQYMNARATPSFKLELKTAYRWSISVWPDHTTDYSPEAHSPTTCTCGEEGCPGGE